MNSCRVPFDVIASNVTFVASAFQNGRNGLNGEPGSGWVYGTSGCTSVPFGLMVNSPMPG